MINFTNVARAPAMTFAVYLKRKACLNDNQSARRKVRYVKAMSAAEAKRIALAQPDNEAFYVEGLPKEVR